MTPEEFFKRLDDANNEDEVRQRIAAGNYNQRHAELAREWLRRREQSREAQKHTRSEEREEEKLEISRRALKNSQKATRLAALALILSTVLGILKVVEWYQG